MKAISITTIICGTAIIIAPMIHDVIATSLVASLLAQTQKHVELNGPLGTSYGGWCLFVGVCMVLAGILLGVFSYRPGRSQASAATQGHRAAALPSVP